MKSFDWAIALERALRAEPSEIMPGRVTTHSRSEAFATQYAMTKYVAPSMALSTAARPVRYRHRRPRPSLPCPEGMSCQAERGNFCGPQAECSGTCVDGTDGGSAGSGGGSPRAGLVQ